MMGSTGKTTHEKVLRTFLNQNKIIFKVTQFWLKTDSPIEDQISNRERELEFKTGECRLTASRGTSQSASVTSSQSQLTL